jgi:hypothetical protein
MILLPDSKFDDKNAFELVQNDFGIDFDKADKDEKCFILHDCFQNVVERVWFGDSYKMSRVVYFMMFLLYICFAPILWISHIILHVVFFLFRNILINFFNF